MNFKDITVGIVTFKSEKVIETCLNSIDQKYTIIIVENSSNVNFKKNIEDKFPNVKCHLTGSNIGMGPANNIGINYAIKNQFEYVMLLNNDTEIDKNFINPLLEAFQKYNKLGAVQPVIMNFYQTLKYRRKQC